MQLTADLVRAVKHGFDEHRCTHSVFSAMSLMSVSLCVATGQIQVDHTIKLNYILKFVIFSSFIIIIIITQCRHIYKSCFCLLKSNYILCTGEIRCSPRWKQSLKDSNKIVEMNLIKVTVPKAEGVFKSFVKTQICKLFFRAKP